MTKEITSILKNIQEEQERAHKLLDRIEAELGTDRQDIDLLKNEVAGFKDKIERFSGQLVKFKEKIGEDMEDAVAKGLKPVGEVVDTLSSGVVDGTIAVSEKTVSELRTRNLFRRLTKKWDTHTLLGKKK